MHLPDRKVNHVVDLISPDEASEGEAFELDDQNVWQTPQQQLFGGLSVLLALWTVPKKHNKSFCVQTNLFLRYSCKHTGAEQHICSISLYC